MALVSLVQCVACAVIAEPAIERVPPLFEVAGVEIRNELSHSVTDVTILVPESGRFVSCGTVLPGTACATSFPLIDYRGNPLSVTWKEHGRSHSMDEFVLQAPAWLDTGRPVWLQIVIFAPGSGGARLLSERTSPR